MALHNDVGTRGEQLIAAHLAQVAPVTPGRTADLCFAGGIEVEVKTSRATLYAGRRQKRGYQFLVEKRGHTSFRNADVLVLICLDDSLNPVATYVLPTAMLRDRQKITIPLNLSSPFNLYRDRWEIIAEVYDGRK
jgi:hypothetical protein